MKKVLLSCLIAFLLLNIVWDTKDYVVGDNLKSSDIKSFYFEDEHDSVTSAGDMIDETVGDKLLRSAKYLDHMYKLPNDEYLLLHRTGGSHKLSEYMYLSFIHVKEGAETKVTVPEKPLYLYNKNDKYVKSNHKIKSKAGSFILKSGEFDNRDESEYKIMNSDDFKSGLSLTPELKKGVIRVKYDGLWVTASNDKVGMDKKMQTYASEQEAVKAVNDGNIGKEVSVLKIDKAHYYFFRKQIDDLDEYTVIPVLLKDNQFEAGKHLKFTFNREDQIESKHEDKVGDIQFKLHFQKDNEKYKKYQHQQKVDKISIAVEEM